MTPKEVLGETSREHELGKILTRMSAEHVARLQDPAPTVLNEYGIARPVISARLLKYLEDELDGKHNPPPPDPKVEALRDEVNAERVPWETNVRAIVGQRPREFEDELVALLRSRMRLVRLGRMARAEEVEDELEHLLDVPFPPLLKAQAVKARADKGLDF